MYFDTIRNEFNRYVKEFERGLKNISPLDTRYNNIVKRLVVINDYPPVETRGIIIFPFLNKNNGLIDFRVRLFNTNNVLDIENLINSSSFLRKVENKVFLGTGVNVYVPFNVDIISCVETTDKLVSGFLIRVHGGLVDHDVIVAYERNEEGKPRPFCGRISTAYLI